MELERFAQLVKRLQEGTRAGKIEWTESTSNSFETTVGGHVIYIAEHEDLVGDPMIDPDYSIGIRRKVRDQWVDSVSDEELKQVLPGAFKTMQMLYKEARRNARGVEGIVDQILKDLE